MPGRLEPITQHRDRQPPLNHVVLGGGRKQLHGVTGMFYDPPKWLFMVQSDVLGLDHTNLSLRMEARSLPDTTIMLGIGLLSINETGQSLLHKQGLQMMRA